ncbi:MAG: SRPBCC family protein [Myxococcaceae bacterium]
MLRNILIALAALLVLLLILIATRPGTYSVSRSTTIAAPAGVVYAQVADFHRWEAWSPWAKLDPAAKLTFGGAASGPGASYAWAGNDKMGEGKMLITSATPNKDVNIKLDFIRPFEASCTTGFVLEPVSGGGTKLTWTMAGENNFMMKAVSLFHDMGADIGGDFDRGLASLKAVSEAEAKRQAEEMAKKAAADAAAAQAAADAAAAQAAAAKPHPKGHH